MDKIRGIIKMMRKKIISIFLVLLMILQFVPINIVKASNY